MIKILYLTALATLLIGCSSPPEPLPVEWDKPAAQINTGLPRWSPNNVIIPSPAVTGQWSQHIPHFNPDNIFTPAVWYAAAHSSEAIVSAPNSESYFMAKTWLRHGGYTGLVAFRPKSDCLNCNNTEIFFYR